MIDDLRRLIEPDPKKLVSVPAAPNHEVLLLGAVASAFVMLRDHALRDGITLLPVSGFRSLERQSVIWDRQYARHEAAGLDPAAAVAKILEYSAPPGWSRHHWGCELDLISADLKGEPRLETADWASTGPLVETGNWLATHAAKFGFLRPYDCDRGGFLPEPWHWSFAPFSRPKLVEIAALDWASWFQSEPFKKAPLLLENLEQERRRFLYGINPSLIP